MTNQGSIDESQSIRQYTRYHVGVYNTLESDHITNILVLQHAILNIHSTKLIQMDRNLTIITSETSELEQEGDEILRHPVIEIEKTSTTEYQLPLPIH